MLSVRDTMTLDLEARWFKHPGAKDAVVMELFGETRTRYAQRLHALLQRPEALVYAPSTVRRLARLAEARRRARTG